MRLSRYRTLFVVFNGRGSEDGETGCDPGKTKSGTKSGCSFGYLGKFEMSETDIYKANHFGDVDLDHQSCVFHTVVSMSMAVDTVFSTTTDVGGPALSSPGETVSLPPNGHGHPVII